MSLLRITSQNHYRAKSHKIPQDDHEEAMITVCDFHISVLYIINFVCGIMKPI